MALYKYADNKLQLLAGSSMDVLPVGTIISNIQSEIDDNFLLCDGSEFDTSKYPVLYSILGTNTVPDLRETVLVGAGENTTFTIAAHDTYDVLEFKDDQLQNHTHYYETTDYGANLGDGRGAGVRKPPSSDVTNARTGTTTHGKQVGVNYFIKATPSASNALDLNALYEYTRNQSILSDLEDFEVSTTNTEVEYDGTIYFTGASSTSYPKQIYINDAVAGHVDCNTSKETKIEVTVSFEVKKGDLVRFTNVANSETGWGAPKPQARWYKLRDYTGR